MKNRIKNYISFFVITLTIVPLHGIQRSNVKKEIATAQAIAQEVSKDISLLDQIVEQADIIINTTNSRERGAAKRKLARLMNHKDLDQKVKDAIDKDIQIIQNKSTSKDAHDAFDRLVAVADKMEAEANAIAVAAQAAKAVETASPEELEQVVAEAQKNMEEADKEVKEEQSTVRRLYSRAKRLVTAPVDYVFGEESSKAKTAFYAAVGTAAAAAMAYGIYKYSKDYELQEELFRQKARETADEWEKEIKKDRVKEIEDEKKGWLEDLQFKNEEEGLIQRFKGLNAMYPISISKSSARDIIKYRLEEWEKFIKALDRHNQSMPSAEKNNMLESAKEAMGALKEQQESFLQQEEALKARYDKDVDTTIEESELH